MISLLEKGVPDVDIYSDFKIVVRNKIFYVHRSILSIKSEKFQTLFQSQFKESRDSILEVDEDPDVYRLFLIDFYKVKSDFTNVSFDKLIRILELLSEYLCIPEMLISYQNEIIKHINYKNYEHYLDCDCYPVIQSRCRAIQKIMNDHQPIISKLLDHQNVGIKSAFLYELITSIGFGGRDSCGRGCCGLIVWPKD